MKRAQRTKQFGRWLLGLRDSKARARVAIRIDRLCAGNAGDVKSLGGGLSELRIDYGPGYRVYFSEQGAALVLLVIGGTKQGQQADIAEAKRLLKQWKDKR